MLVHMGVVWLPPDLPFRAQAVSWWWSISIPTLQAWGTSRCGAVPGAFSKEMAKGDSRFKDFPKGHPLEASACAQGAQGAQVWLREQQEGCDQPGDPLPALQPPPTPPPAQLCDLGGMEQGRACTQEAQQLLGSRAAINWVFHSLPCQGRVGVGRRGQEVQVAGRGNQLHESPQRPAADGQDTRRKHGFPWIRHRGQGGTSP